jgi:UBA-like domain
VSVADGTDWEFGCIIRTHYTLSLFSTAEKSVLKKKEERDVDSTISSTGSRDELERAMLVKMKSVTNASEDVCISMLESNGYDLKSSIETYFQSR